MQEVKGKKEERMNIAEGNGFKEVINLLEDIRKLLVLDLISRGIQGKDIANALGVHGSTITRMVPARKVKVEQNDTPPSSRL